MHFHNIFLLGLFWDIFLILTVRFSGNKLQVQWSSFQDALLFEVNLSSDNPSHMLFPSLSFQLNLFLWFSQFDVYAESHSIKDTDA